MSEAIRQRSDTAHSAVGNGGQELAAAGAIDHIRDALRGLKFGNVSIVVQDGVVIQIERTERKRLR